MAALSHHLEALDDMTEGYAVPFLDRDLETAIEDLDFAERRLEESGMRWCCFHRFG